MKSESEVAQSCLPLSDPMDCSLPGSSIHGIFQARVLEWGAIAFSESLESGVQIEKALLKRKGNMGISKVALYRSYCKLLWEFFFNCKYMGLLTEVVV